MDAATTPNLTAIETPPTPPADFETTPEFAAFKTAKLAEVKAYLADNWKIKDAELVMVPQFTFPDRENRKAYASISSGQSFRDENGKIVVNPATGQPMTYTIWRKVEPPAPVPAEENSVIEDTKPDVNPAA